ncbi:MAG: type II 3-dehydroquinate dehydratase [Calditrichaeota bacterium]|nr:MAG: type II 3-dehydroquinate dehydratase [Calditrichota bacterium]
MKIIDVIHGPNLNLLGSREPEIYGTDALEPINAYIQEKTAEYNVELHFFQSNHEGAIIERIHAARGTVDGIVINPAAYTHYSIAIRDALSAVAVPVVDVHLSDISKREDFRRTSVISDICLQQIGGFGKNSYVFGVEALIGYGALRRMKEEWDAVKNRDDMLKKAVDVLHATFPKYDWTGIYLVDGDELDLHNFHGAPSPHSRIPIGQGICGAAVAERDSIIVPDVNADPRYLACSIETKSEIVVPIYAKEEIVGEIDIDSHRLDVFKKHDRKFLEEVAGEIGLRW